MDILTQVTEVMQYGFMQRALVAGACIALACSFLGVFLVLRRFSLIGDSIAHTSITGIAVALLVGAQPVFVSLPLVIAASLYILKLSEGGNVYGDAAIGLVSSFGIAAGVFIVSLAGGFSVDLCNYLFGNILSISPFEVGLTVALSAAVIAVCLFFYHDLFSISFDEEFARVCGIRVNRINRVLIILVSCTVVLGVRVVGVMLISSLLILPAVTALQIGSGFKKVIAIAAAAALASVVLGVFLAFMFNFPAGATIVLINFFFFLAASIWKRGRR